jgi:hypothetical protein
MTPPRHRKVRGVHRPRNPVRFEAGNHRRRKRRVGEGADCGSEEVWCDGQHSPPGTVAFVLAFAAGAILTMLANTIMPEAYEHGGKWVGVVTTLGFAVAFAIHTLD